MNKRYNPYDTVGIELHSGREEIDPILERELDELTEDIEVEELRMAKKKKKKVKKPVY